MFSERLRPRPERALSSKLACSRGQVLRHVQIQCGLMLSEAEQQ
jgi:hypothetical protein